MHSTRYIPRVLAFSALVISFVSGTWGQVVTGSLTGAIRDTTGATVLNARVIVISQATGVSQSTTTTSDGIYNLPYLGPGTYRVEIKAQGFKTFAEDNVQINVSSTQRVDATLIPGNVQETVTVTGESPVLQTEGAEVSRSFQAQTLRELPVANRNFQA